MNDWHAYAKLLIKWREADRNAIEFWKNSSVTPYRYDNASIQNMRQRMYDLCALRMRFT